MAFVVNVAWPHQLQPGQRTFPVGLCLSVPLCLALDLALESEGEISWPVCLQELSGFVSLCSIRAGWECAHRERGNVFDIRSAHTVGEAGTAGYD